MDQAWESELVVGDGARWQAFRLYYVTWPIELISKFTIMSAYVTASPVSPEARTILYSISNNAAVVERQVYLDKESISSRVFLKFRTSSINIS